MSRTSIEGRMKELVDTARPHLREELEATLATLHRQLANLVGTTLKEPVVSISLEPVEQPCFHDRLDKATKDLGDLEQFLKEAKELDAAMNE